MKKCIVIFSGGQDSTTCLIKALTEYDEILALTFDYQQRNIEEVNNSKKIISKLNEKKNIFHCIYDASFISKITSNSMVNTDQEIRIIDNLPNTFVAGRNHLFISIASIIAYEHSITDIILGVSEADYSGYPDCRKEFITSLNKTLNLALDYNLNILTPLMDLDKCSVWELSDNLGKLDFIKNNTITCYNGIIGDGCGTCPSCILRKEGLEKYTIMQNGESYEY